MKKLIILIFVLIAISSKANDAKTVVSMAFEQILNRPSGLTEKQAMDLYLHSGKIDSIPTSNSIIIRKFGLLELIPLLGNWENQTILTPIYHNGNRWVQNPQIITYSKAQIVNVIMSSILIILFFYLLFLPYYEVKHLIRNVHSSDSPNDARLYLKYYSKYGKANGVIFATKQFFYPAIFLIISILFLVPINPWLFICLEFWTLFVASITMILRKNLIRKTTEEFGYNK